MAHRKSVEKALDNQMDRIRKVLNVMSIALQEHCGWMCDDMTCAGDWCEKHCNRDKPDIECWERYTASSAIGFLKGKKRKSML